MDPAIARRLRAWAMFVGIAGLILFFQLLPLRTAPRALPGPDLLVCLSFAWIQRRPDFVPPLLLAGLLFLADILLMRPLGLWALLVLLGAEFLRSRQNPSVELPFLGEWAFVAVVTLSITALYALLLGMVGLENLQVAKLAVQAFMTVTFYPLVVGVTVGILNIRKPTQHEIESQRAAG